MNDTACAEVSVTNHIERFWKYLETETVRIALDLKRTVAADAPYAPIVYWDGASFSDDVAKALVAEHEEISKLRASQARLKSAIEFAHAEGFQWPSDPMAEFVDR